MEYLPQQPLLMKHASIDLCNCKYTELEQCMSMLFTLCDSHQSPQYTMLSAQFLLINNYSHNCGILLARLDALYAKIALSGQLPSTSNIYSTLYDTNTGHSYTR